MKYAAQSKMPIEDIKTIRAAFFEVPFRNGQGVLVREAMIQVILFKI